ncbi:MAG TPA: alpha-galactosidase [Ktedonobacteraceae bacterium]|nr:alpha-galactosidase [Ktedonobacteraceae bacterium]
MPEDQFPATQLAATQPDPIASVLSPGIHYRADKRSWMFVTEQSCYALGITPENLVLHLYWGPRLTSFAGLPEPQLPHERASQSPALTVAAEEYPVFGGLRYNETAAKATFADGTRDLDLHFADFEMIEQATLPELHIQLRDKVYPLHVTLRYQVDIANDLIIRSVSFTNVGSETIILDRVFSAIWHLPRQFAGRTLTTLAGHWAGETRVQCQPLVAGTAFIESRRGITGSTAYPWFAIESDDQVHAGDTYFGTLAWSGNWVIRTTTTIIGTTAIAGGIHDHDFAWQLKSGASFETPEFVAGFAADHMDGARHRLHRYISNHVLPQLQAGRPRPVLYNSWEATTFDVTEEGQAILAERAAQLGVELFTVDDGWFAGRPDDHSGLGDWYADPRKFPRGLHPLVQRVHTLGMQFGLWVEPEMVNPDSELYRAHPDWVYYFPTRPRSEARNQLVLNVSRPDVQSYLIDILDKLVGEHKIQFLKWDMNRPISEAGWPTYVAQGGEAREIWVRHTWGVYAIMDELRRRHPHLSIESCSSGGSRADLGILRRTDQVWSSDNTHPDARLLIQEGISHILPARVMGAWVTDAGRHEIPLTFRFHVSMMGMLGIGGHLLHWTDEEMAEAKKWIAIYKELRPLLQGQGEQYWLISPTSHNGTLAAVEYVAPDASEAIVFAFRRIDAFYEALPPLRLQHLRPDALYCVETPGSDMPTETRQSGALLMNRGLELPLHRGPYASCIVRLRLT